MDTAGLSNDEVLKRFLEERAKAVFNSSNMAAMPVKKRAEENAEGTGIRFLFDIPDIEATDNRIAKELAKLVFPRTLFAGYKKADLDRVKVQIGIVDRHLLKTQRVKYRDERQLYIQVEGPGFIIRENLEKYDPKDINAGQIQSPQEGIAR